MNRQILKNYINEYKLNFDRVSELEIYKWKAVKCFQDNWNLNADNFHKMLMKSISLTQNLLMSGRYFPLGMLRHYSEVKPEKVRNLFKDLYNEEEDILDRIQNFQDGINDLNKALSPGKNSFQDHRAIMVYLALCFPSRYFFYKFEMFKQFSEKLGFIYKPVKGHIENLGHFNSMCGLIRYELSKDQELLKLHKNRITADCYYDENLNILTQDFIYAVTRHLNQIYEVETLTVPEATETMVLATDLSIADEGVDFRGRTVNYIQNNIDNKHIGDLGEHWVMRHEKDKLKKANKHNLAELVKHTSKDEGDGTGFDIQSFDIEGNKIFIEVKTTKGNKNSMFYMSKNELERSKEEKDNYYLYRLYNYNEQTDSGDLLIIKGDLTNLCRFPIKYKINLIDMAPQ
jgi:hypothetical protein